MTAKQLETATCPQKRLRQSFLWVASHNFFKPIIHTTTCRRSCGIKNKNGHIIGLNLASKYLTSCIFLSSISYSLHHTRELIGISLMIFKLSVKASSVNSGFFSHTLWFILTRAMGFSMSSTGQSNIFLKGGYHQNGNASTSHHTSTSKKFPIPT
jgi:hypothetical protein